MKRLFQFGTILFLWVTVCAPLVECFDRWDAPGLSNDIEFSLFLIVLLVTLVLVVANLVAVLLLSRQRMANLSALLIEPFSPEPFLLRETAAVSLLVPPLRI
ncbi:MAG: hypothetical protein HOQ35_22070 [Acidobacteriaceae bacterium]|nr:hypothetical protein [Acidobacteriaceae bacterium]